MEFDRRDHIARLKTHDSAAGQDLDLPLCHLRSHPELARHGRKVLLQDLWRHHSRPAAKMLCKQLDRPVLFLRRRGIVGVHQQVGIEESETAHLRSCNSSRLNFHPRALPWASRESRSNSAASAFGSAFPTSCSRYSRTSWFTLVPMASARRLASWTTPSSMDRVTFINT